MKKKLLFLIMLIAGGENNIVFAKRNILQTTIKDWTNKIAYTFLSSAALLLTLRHFHKSATDVLYRLGIKTKYPEIAKLLYENIHNDLKVHNADQNSIEDISQNKHNDQLDVVDENEKKETSYRNPFLSLFQKNTPDITTIAPIAYEDIKQWLVTVSYFFNNSYQQSATIGQFITECEKEHPDTIVKIINDKKHTIISKPQKNNNIKWLQNIKEDIFPDEPSVYRIIHDSLHTFDATYVE